ncbi:MAG: hypothetical protein DI630_31430 [Gordonia sp. (in: high G+C Gram-positive bacteria)]|nr:MAG: hypothetical protein DI630_31430 [Gordonia sp. (in: high G+C Gram-positive bacteria)]
MSNPFSNPYEPEPSAGQPGPGSRPIGGGPANYATPPAAAPQPYLAPSQLDRPVAPRGVTIVVVVLCALAAFLVVGMLLQLRGGGSGFFFGLAAVINVALAWGLSKRPGKTVRALTTAYAGLWCLTGIGLVASVPMIVLLWQQEAKDYFAAGERWNAARSVTRS